MIRILFILTAVLLVTTYATAGLEDDLVIYLTFDNVKNEQVLDASGEKLHADLISNTNFVKGRYGNAIHIARDAQRTDCVNVLADDMLKIKGEITMMAWVYHEDWDKVSGQWIDKGTHNQSNAYGMGSFNDLRAFNFNVRDKSIGLLLGGTKGTWYFFTTNPIEGKGWHHIAGTYDGKFAKIYLDGKLISEDESEFEFAGTNDLDLRIGCVKDHPQYNFKNGLIDEVGIWRRALTEAEIKEAMKDIFAVSPKDKTATTWSDIKQGEVSYQRHSILQ